MMRLGSVLIKKIVLMSAITLIVYSLQLHFLSLDDLIEQVLAKIHIKGRVVLLQAEFKIQETIKMNKKTLL